MEKLVEMMQLQLQQQPEMQAQEQRFRDQAEAQEQRFRETTGGPEGHASTPCETRSIGAGLTASYHFRHSTFSPSDSTSELWKDYWSRFLTFYESSCCSRWPKGAGFSHQPVVDGVQAAFKPCGTRTPPRDVNNLTMDQIVAYMKVQFDPTRLVIRERF